MLEGNSDLKYVIKATVVEELGDSVASAVRRACKGISISEQEESVTVGNVFKEIVSSEKYWKVHNSILLDHDSLLNRPRRGSSYVTLSKEQIEDLCESLYHPVLQYRLKAMEYLIRCVSTDSFLTLSCWERLESGLRQNLNHSVCVISEASLQVYKKFLVSSTPELNLESYIGLLKFLSSALHRESPILMLCRKDFVADVVQLVNKFQRNIPKHWLRYPTIVITGIVVNTFEFYNQCQWFLENDRLGLGHYLWLSDPKGIWVSNFLCSVISRQALYMSLSNCLHILKSLVESCTLFLENRLPNTSHVIESISILSRLFQIGDSFTGLEKLSFHNFESAEFGSEWLKMYSDPDSMWSLFISVYRKLLKFQENVFWLTGVFSNIIQSRMEKHSSTELLLFILGDSLFRNDIEYIIFLTDCVATLSRSSQCRQLLLKNSNVFQDILEYISNQASIDELSNLSSKMVLYNCYKIMKNLFIEPSSFLLLNRKLYEQFLLALCKINFSSNLENSIKCLVSEIIIRFSQNELGMVFLEQNFQCIENCLNHFPIEALINRDNIIQLCLQILSLTVASPIAEQIKTILAKCVTKSLSVTVSVDCDCQTWRMCFQCHQKIIPYYTSQVLQCLTKTDKEISSEFCNMLFTRSDIKTDCDKCFEVLKLNSLNCLLCDLNILFYLQTQGNIVQHLLDQQEFEVSENGPIFHETSLIRNHLLVRISVFGGSKERCLPEKKFSNENIVSMGTDFSKNILFNEDVLLQYETLELLEDNDLHCFFIESVSKKTISSKLSLFVITALIQNQDSINFETFHEGLSDNDDSISYGIKATVEYGLQQKRLYDQNIVLHCTNLRVLMNYLNESSSTNGWTAFNFLAGSIFIISGGGLQISAQFLKILEIEKNNSSIVRLLNSIQDTKPTFLKGVICSYFSIIVQEQLPLVFNTFSMAEFPIDKCLTLWLGQCFWNVLNLDQIVSVVILSYFENPYYLVYMCVALLKQMEKDLFCHMENNDLHCFIREYSSSNFDIYEQLDFLSELNEKYSLTITEKLNNYLT